MGSACDDNLVGVHDLPDAFVERTDAARKVNVFRIELGVGYGAVELQHKLVGQQEISTSHRRQELGDAIGPSNPFLERGVDADRLEQRNIATWNIDLREERFQPV